jgi:outer membrane protein OmpA-like peptidoglycan-associated protein
MKQFIFVILFSFFLVPVARANVLGEMQTFAPNTDGLDFITVHSARPLNKSFFASSNYLNFAKDHLLVYENYPGQNRVDYSNHLFEYDFGITYAVSHTWQVSLMAPFLLDYASETKNGIHIDLTRGVHAYRPGTKWTFYQNNGSYAAGLFSIDYPYVKNSPYTGVDPKPIFNFELAYLTKSPNTTHGLNLGYRKRLPTETPTDARMFPLKDQAIASYGLSTTLTETSRFVFELFGSYPINKDPYERATDVSSLDALFALKHFWWKYLRFDWGVTVANPQKTLSPSYRVFAGLVYYWKNDLSGTENPNDEYMQKEVTTVAPLPEEVSSSDDPLVVLPENDELYTRATLPIEVSGGESPYIYEVITGDGFVSTQGVYTAPSRPGISQVRVTDMKGRSKLVDLTIIAPPKADREIRLTHLEFVTGKDALIPRSQKDLTKNLEQLRGLNISSVIVEGHTDNVGSSQSNVLLSQKRSAVVRRALIRQLGLPEKSVKAIGYGEDVPLVDNLTAGNRQKNRRVELKVYFKK